jgi:ABC-type dipeptide/oligopeptide/nickel transport system permease component
VGRWLYIGRRVIGALVTIAVATVLDFFLFRAGPGGVSSLAYVPGGSPQLKEALRRDFGLDEPVLSQLRHYLEQLVLHGNMGISYADRQPVAHNLLVALGNTVPMVGFGLLFALLLAFGTATAAAWYRGTPIDHGARGVALLLFGIPAQWLAMLFIFGFRNSLPVGGMSDPFLVDPSTAEHLQDVARHMLLPSLTFGLTAYAQFMLILRTSLLDALTEDYIVTAQAKGLGATTILRRHALRNALLPVTTMIGLAVGGLASGAIIIETAFSWPGVGNALYQAVSKHDYPMLSGAFVFITAAVVFANLIVDLLYGLLDPRVRAHAT